MIYCYARLAGRDFGLFRLFGTGLGNALFPWARSMLASRRDGLTEIWPTWRQVFHRGGWHDLWKESTGAYGLKNLRNYDNIFVAGNTQVTGPRKLGLLFGSQKVSESDYNLKGIAELPNGAVVVFEGLAERYAPILKEHRFLREELGRRSRPDLLAAPAAFDFARSITVHVRLGDFRSNSTSAGERHWRHNTRLPLSWYVENIGKLRAALGDSWPVHVFSDGTDAELAELLAVRNCERLGFGSALADMWAMSLANVLVCSLSTLATWASYLGRPPIIHLRGFLQPLYYDDPSAEIESEHGEALPESFLRNVEKRIAGSP